MGAEYNPDNRGEGMGPEDPHPLLAEVLWVGGRKFLSLHDDEATVRAVGDILRGELFKRYVSPESYGSLHTDITPQMAYDGALELSVQLMFIKLNHMPEGAPFMGRHSDVIQVLNGTSMATREALALVALGVGRVTNEVLEEARSRTRAEGWGE